MKSHPAGTALDEVVELVVELLEVVEVSMLLETELVVEELDVREEVGGEPDDAKRAPRPTATTMTTINAAAAVILAIPLREVSTIPRYAPLLRYLRRLICRATPSEYL